MAFLRVLGVLSLMTAAVSSVYVYNGDPFQKPGPLQPVETLTLTPDKHGIPKRTEVFYPAVPGTYVSVLFIPGVFGAIYTEWYSTVLTHLASYGVIVAGIDVQWPLLDDGHRKGGEEVKAKELRDRVLKAMDKDVDISSELETLFKVIDWLIKDLVIKINDSEVVADWSKMGIMSHSLGAVYITEMLQANSTFAKAAAFLEPASSNFKYPLNYTIPALAYGGQLDMEKPACLEMGHSYFHYYSLLTCPKILMNVTDFGHCDINDNVAWELCHLVHFCKTDPSNNRTLYREVFVPGVLASFFGTYLQGNTELVSYITHRDNMPLPLGQLWFDLNCTATHREIV